MKTQELHCLYESYLKLRGQVEDKLREEQYNFRDNRSRVDVIFAVRQK
jgi:uncharacterized protein YdeI (BOF family)